MEKPSGVCIINSLLFAAIVFNAVQNLLKFIPSCYIYREKGYTIRFFLSLFFTNLGYTNKFFAPVYSTNRFTFVLTELHPEWWILVLLVSSFVLSGEL